MYSVRILFTIFQMKIVCSIRRSKSEQSILEGTTRYCPSMLWAVEEKTTLLIILVQTCKQYFRLMDYSNRAHSGDFEVEKARLRNCREVAKCRLMLTKVLGAEVAKIAGVRKLVIPSPERGLSENFGMSPPCKLPTWRHVGVVQPSARFNLLAIDKALEEASDSLDVQLGVYGIQFAERTSQPSPSEQHASLSAPIETTGSRTRPEGNPQEDC